MPPPVGVRPPGTARAAEHSRAYVIELYVIRKTDRFPGRRHPQDGVDNLSMIRKTERFPGRRHPQDGVDNLTEGSSMAFFTAR